MITADPGTVFSASVSTGASGQVGLLAVQVVIPGEQLVVIPRTTVGITEFPAGSGVYGVELKAPLAPGLYQVIWDTAGAGPLTTANVITDQLVVNFKPVEYYAENELIYPWAWGPGRDISSGAPGSNPIPTAADVRAASQLNWTDYGAGLGSDTGPAGLQELVDRAESAFWNITGQTLDSIDSKWAPQVRRVVQGMTETLAMQASSDVLDTTADWDLISSFSAGPYDENHRSPKDMLDGRMLWPVPWVSQALWGLLTPERYGFWMSYFAGYNQPAFEGTDVYWEDGQILSDLYGPPPGLGYWGGA